MMNINVPIVISLGAYTILMLIISIFWMLRVKKPVDFLMARRRLGPAVLTGTVLATGVGTGVTLGASGLAYRTGWGGCVYPIGLGLGMIVVGLLFSKMRNYNFMTLSEEIACYYGGNIVVYNFSNIALFFSKVFWLTVQIMGGGFIISLVTGFPLNQSIIIAGVLIGITSIPGGLLTVVYTDVAQAMILVAGFLVLASVSLSNLGGFSGLRASVPSEYFSFLGVKSLGWKSVISIPIALILSMIADTNNRHRIYSSTSEKAVKIGLYTAGTFEILFSVLIGIIGMSVFALNPSLQAQDQAIPWLATNVLNTWLAAIIVVSVSAAVLSSGDSDAAVSATFFIRHIYPMFTKKRIKNPLRITRIGLVVIFIVSTVIALYAGTIVDFVINFLSVILSGLAIVILLGKYWKRSTWQGAVTAIIVGAIVSLIVMYVPSQREFWVRPIIPATLAAFIGEVLVSLFTTHKKIPFKVVAETLTDERKDKGLEEVLEEIG
jgi:SSS family solute:Na+ symporter